MSNRGLFGAFTGVVLAAVCSGCVAEDGAEGVDDAGASACTAERHSVEQAVESYIVLEGSFPASEADLVPNYLRTESASMDVDANGNVVAAPGSGCI